MEMQEKNRGGLPAFTYNPPIETVAFGWGVNEDGQLGLIEHGNIHTPKVIEGLLGTKFRGRAFAHTPIVAGSRNTMAVTADGQVYSWGWNDRATLGQGHQEHVAKPRKVMGMAGVQIVQVALGGWHALAVDSRGQCWAWGGNEYNQCDAGPGLRDILEPRKCIANIKVVQVDAGGMHSVALTDTGHIWMWGEPWGDFSMTINREPSRLDISSKTKDTIVVKVACGAFHNLALTANGNVYSWGINDYGQLGNGTTSNSTVPLLIEEGLYPDVKVADIAAGGWHSLAITEHGEVYVWGRGEYGRLGLGGKNGASRLRPTKVEGMEGHRVVEASCGGTHTLVVTDEGRMFVWGRGSFGRLGTGTEKDYFSPVEVMLPGGPERWWVIAASAGGRHSMCLAVPDNSDLDEDGRSTLGSRGTSVSSASRNISVPAVEPISPVTQGSAAKLKSEMPKNAWISRENSVIEGDDEDADDENENEDEGEDDGSPFYDTGETSAPVSYIDLISKQLVLEEDGELPE